MHFGLSHSRSKSRSPAPSSPFAQYARPPTFLPPSHYAAAAGISYQDHDVNRPPFPTVARQHAEVSGELAGSHFGAVGRLMGRSPGKHSPVVPVSPEYRVEPEQHIRERRKSQLGDIPLLETQLLPSLRDTVDRMTQPPPSKPEESIETSTAPLAPIRRGRDMIVPSPSASSSIAPKPGCTWGPSPSTGIPRLNPTSPPAPKSALKSPGRRSAANATLSSPASSHRTRNTRFAESESIRELLSGSETSVSDSND